MYRTYLKKRILVQGVGGAGFQTAGILKYVEDLKAGTNTQIGPKDFFEIGSGTRNIESITILEKPKMPGAWV